MRKKKTINGTQWTIAFYVDDNKISHKDSNVVTEVIDILKGHVGKVTVYRGREHTFLGMNVNMREDKNIYIEIKDQLMEAIEMFNKEG